MPVAGHASLEDSAKRCRYFGPFEGIYDSPLATPAKPDAGRAIDLVDVLLRDLVWVFRVERL